MPKKKVLPAGVDLFEKIVEQDYYYVDKTLLIREIMDRKGEVNLLPACAVLEGH